MICNRQIGHLKISLDSKDRVIEFEFNKFNCNRPPGTLSVLPYITGKKADNLLSVHLKNLTPNANSFYGPMRNILVNQFESIKIALSIYLGMESPSPDFPFTIQSIVHDADGTEITGYTTLPDSLSEQFGCGRCRGHSGKRHAAG